jgi:phage/plasmid primase-like uncharacterized protein
MLRHMMLGLRDRAQLDMFPEMLAQARAVPIELEAQKRGFRLKRCGCELVGPCPVCGGTNRFAINTAKQVWHCRGCGLGGDVIALVRHTDRCSFPEAITTLVGGNGERRRDRDDLLNDEDRDRRASAHDFTRAHDLAARLWEQASPLGPEATGYFERRGIDMDAVPEQGGLRWHPRCPWGSGTKSCVMARYTDTATGEPRGIWRRPITGEKPMSLGPMSGCVIRLWPDDAVNEGLVIGEGIETTLAAATRIEHRGALLRPAWATGSAGNMAMFPVLAGIEALTILVDHDASGAGQKAAEACAQRWGDAGRKVSRLMPGDLGADFNNLVTP